MRNLKCIFCGGYDDVQVWLDINDNYKKLLDLAKGNSNEAFFEVLSNLDSRNPENIQICRMCKRELSKN